MATNEPIPDKNDGDEALGRLFAALEGEDGIRSLAGAIEHGDPEQLAHWYGLLSEVRSILFFPNKYSINLEICHKKIKNIF